jgi:uncharacterized protein with von Willebrand factor type A (vWA) domain
MEVSEPYEPKMVLEKGPNNSSMYYLLYRQCIDDNFIIVAAMISFIPQFELDEQKAEIIFVLDRSGSMGGSKIEHLKQAMQARIFIEFSILILFYSALLEIAT